MNLIVHVVQLHDLTFLVPCCGRYHFRFVCTPICFTLRRSCFIGVIYRKYCGVRHDYHITWWCSCSLTVTRRVSIVEQGRLLYWSTGTASLLEHLSLEITTAFSFLFVFCGFPVALVFCVVFCRSLSICSISLCHSESVPLLPLNTPLVYLNFSSIYG